MEQVKQITNSCYSRMIGNSGGPCSRIRSMPVRETMLKDTRRFVESGWYGLQIPGDIINIEQWLLEMAEGIGWHGWREINRHLSLPGEKLMVFPDSFKNTSLTPSIRVILQHAVVLSKCNNNFYLPGGPKIFTRSRLDTVVRLIKINITGFYEMD